MRSRALTIVLLAAGVAGAAIAVPYGVSRTRSASASPIALRPMSELALREREIAFYEQRAFEDTLGAADRAQLAGLYMQRARETGSYADFTRAETAARRSLELRTSRNGRAMLTLASSLLAQHHFEKALAVATELCALYPDVVGYRALRAELQLETGDYAAARLSFDSLAPVRRDLAVAPRMARWAEITGKTEDARRILYEAVFDARNRTSLPREQLAWFHLRVGDLELRSGRLGDAERALRAGLRVEPGDHRLLSALARLEALRHRWRKVIEYGARVGDRADISTLALMGDAYQMLGDSGAARRLHDRAEAAGRENAEPYNRQWTLFQLDHDRNLAETLALLRQEIAGRSDVYGYDQLAWALHRSGDHRAARDAMTQALRMGTQDAMLFFHAGMIERSLGERERARHFLERALAVNPHFHHLQPGIARAVLDD
ncbi:MAG: tetratricopeptide repeat protein [Gemmatimonadaceae bacterium]